MSDVGEWLSSIGLDALRPAFAREGVDMDLLRELTDHDLVQLGVRRLGDRKRLLRAIRELRPESVPPPERRVVSVLFCDLVGSTALSVGTDPEDLRRFITSFLDTVVSSIEKYGGHIGNLLGDGVLAYFGWPHADEQQAIQAVRAAIDATAAVQVLQFAGGLTPHCRAGIATGRIVIGGRSDIDSAFGETLNLAARLQAVAGPDEVVVDELTAHAVGNSFALELLDPVVLKGFPSPVNCYRACYERRGLDRFEQRQREVVPFEGRLVEMELLRGLWQDVVRGTGRVARVVGDAGIGKSRLVREFLLQTLPPPTTVIRLQCSQYWSASPFHPIVDTLERVAGLESGEGHDDRRRKLATALSLDPASDEITLATELLAAPDSVDALSGTKVAKERRAQLISFLVRYVAAEASQRPVVVLVEDAHWIDPSTAEVVDAVSTSSSRLPVLVLTTHRPGPVTVGKSAAVIELSGLGRDETARIARSIDSTGRLSSLQIGSIVARVDGVPLFAQELTAAAVESGRLVGTENLPETIEASIRARLDNLGAAKTTAYVASVLGREFSRVDLITLSGLSSAAVDSALDRIVSSGLVRAVGDSERYRFSHALVRDVAYGSTLREARRRMHVRVVENVMSDGARAASPELVAYHLTEAGEVERAIASWAKAGRLATSRSANAEAIEHYRRGIDLVLGLPEGRERDSRAFNLYVGMAAPVIAEHGYMSRELEECIISAVALSALIEHTKEVFSLIYSRWAALLTTGSILPSLDVALEFSRLAEHHHDEDALVARHRMLGASQMCLGNLEEAGAHLRQLVESYRSDRAEELTLAYGVNLEVAGRCFLSEVEWLSGSTEEAAASAERALVAAHATGHTNSIGMALHFCTLVAFLNHSEEAVLRYGSETSAMASRQALGGWPILISAAEGWARVTKGDVAEGFAAMERGVAQAQAAGVLMFIPFFLCRLADMYLSRDLPQEADRYVGAAEDVIKRTGEVCYASEVNRMRGELMWLLGDESRAEECYRNALRVAGEQGAHSLELQTAVTYARRLRELGRPGEALRLLRPVVPRFEGRQTRGAGEARDLVALLAQDH